MNITKRMIVGLPLAGVLFFTEITGVRAGNFIVPLLDAFGKPVTNCHCVLRMSSLPQSQNNGTAIQWRTTATSDSSGNIVESNAAPGVWTVQPLNVNLSAFSFYMPVTNGTIFAQFFKIRAGDTIPPGSVSYSVDASDLRYQATGAGSNAVFALVPPLLTSLLQTSSIASAQVAGLGSAATASTNIFLNWMTNIATVTTSAATNRLGTAAFVSTNSIQAFAAAQQASTWSMFTNGSANANFATISSVTNLVTGDLQVYGMDIVPDGTGDGVYLYNAGTIAAQIGYGNWVIPGGIFSVISLFDVGSSQQPNNGPSQWQISNDNGDNSHFTIGAFYTHSTIVGTNHFQSIVDFQGGLTNSDSGTTTNYGSFAITGTAQASAFTGGTFNGNAAGLTNLVSARSVATLPATPQNGVYQYLVTNAVSMFGLTNVETWDGHGNWRDVEEIAAASITNQFLVNARMAGIFGGQGNYLGEALKFPLTATAYSVNPTASGIAFSSTVTAGLSAGWPVVTYLLGTATNAGSAAQVNYGYFLTSATNWSLSSATIGYIYYTNALFFSGFGGQFNTWPVNGAGFIYDPTTNKTVGVISGTATNDLIAMTVVGGLATYADTGFAFTNSSVGKPVVIDTVVGGGAATFFTNGVPACFITTTLPTNAVMQYYLDEYITNLNATAIGGAGIGFSQLGWSIYKPGGNGF